MFIVHVHIQVKPQWIGEFIIATNENVEKSRNEPGIARFDLIQQIDEQSRFVLIEVYRSPDDPYEHKETEHYKKWRDTVEKMMEIPRKSVKFKNISPVDDKR
jgi:quinol monooxygenase YgiN